MNEMQILDAVERYLRGEMSPQEIASFEELRKSNPEIDQMVVEHTYFLQNLETYEATKNYKHSLNEIEAKLSEEGFITKPQMKGTAKVVYLWKKYKRNVAVAASIAGIVSVVSGSVMVIFTKHQVESTKTELVDYVNTRTKAKNNITVINGNTAITMPPQVDFRATGFLIDNKGYLVTNAHVVERMKNIYVQNNKGDYFTAVTVYTDKNADLAVLKINDSSFKETGAIPYTFKKTSYDLGEQIFTLGFPKNEFVYGEGYLSAASGNEGDSTAYQLSVSANPGNSGGPVVNKNGEIIGIITSKDSKADGVVYAAKSKDIFKMVEDLKKTDSTINIKVPSGSGLKGLERTQQIKKMEEFVYMVVGNANQ